VLDGGEEVADAVVGQARLEAALGQLDQAVVEHDGGAARVDDALVAEEEAAAAAAEGGRDLDLDVLGERLDLVPGAAAAVQRTDAELGEVGHEDVAQVDEDALAAGVDAADLQGHQHRVGVGGLDRLGDGRAGLGLEVDVAADQVEFGIADLLEQQHPLLVEV